MPAVFISHSSRDARIAGDLKAMLAKLGFEQIFLDFDKESGIGAGENWERRLHDELARCHAVMLVLTPQWLASKWCFAELVQARALGKVVLPVICEPLGEQRVLAEIQAVDLVDWNAEGLGRIEQRLLAITDNLARGFALDPSRSPYPGIHAFETEDAAIYFGRDAEARAVIERLDARRTSGGARLQLIIGASGSGKSSLLRAGVLPQLASRRQHWRLLPLVRPEKAPLEAIAKTIAHELDTPQDWEAWHRRLGGEDAVEAIDRLLKSLRVGEARAATILLAIDQFEEVFTVASPAERQAFLRLLTGALDPARGLPLLVVATGRSDVLDGLIQANELAPLCETIALAAMPLERVPVLVQGPATVAGLNVDPGLPERMMRDLERPEALPLLAHTLWLLYRNGAADRRLTLAEYQQLGDPQRGFNPIQNSVRLAADRAIAGLAPPASDAELAALRDAFIFHLVRVRLDDDRPTRQMAQHADLPAAAQRLVRALIEARLLTTRDGTVEVAHEALFKAWPTLDQWLTAEHAFLTDIERLRSALEVWRQAAEPQKPAALLRGLLLSRARDWQTRHAAAFAAGELKPIGDFIAASAQAEDAERQRLAAQATRARRVERRLFQVAIAAALVFATAAVAAGWQYLEAEQARRHALLQQKEAESQRNQALVTQSRFLTDLARQQQARGDHGTAIALLLEALPDAKRGAARPYVSEVERALHASVANLRESRTLGRHARAVGLMVVSADGRVAATTAQEESGVRLWSTDGRALSTLPSKRPARMIALSPDGARLAVAHQGWRFPEVAVAEIWDTASGTQIGALHGHRGPINTVAYSPDGRTLLTASADGTARLWEASTGKPLQTLEGHDGEVEEALFSPDGRYIATRSLTRLILSKRDPWVRLWDARTGTVLGHIGDGRLQATDMAFSPDSTRLVMSLQHLGPTQVFDVENRAVLSTLKGLEGASRARFSPDGTTILTPTGNALRQWDARTGAEGPVLRSSRGYWAAYAPGGRLILALSGSGAQIWDAASGNLAAQLAHEDEISSAVFVAGGTRVLTGSRDGSVRLWTVARPVTDLKRAHEPIEARFSPDGKAVLTRGQVVELWKVEDGSFLGALHKLGDGPVQAMAVSPDGRRAVTAPSKSRLARVWDVATNAEIAVLKGHDADTLLSVAFSPDGRRVITSAGDGTARIWAADTGAPLQVLGGHRGAITTTSFARDGGRAMTVTAEGQARVWESATGGLVGTFGARVSSAALSADGRWIVVIENQAAVVLEVATGRKVATLDHQMRVWTAAFSPDAKLLVTMADDNAARVWQIEKAEVVRTLASGTNLGDGTIDAVFSADGRRILTSTPDGGRLWDTASGAELAVFGDGRSTVATDGEVIINVTAFSPDGTRVLEGSRYQGLRLWPIFANTQELIDHARTILPRPLTAAQRRRYFLASD